MNLQIERPYVEALITEFPRLALAKLAAKFCSHKQVRPSSEVFRRCSIFRGMALERPAQQPCSV